MLCAAALLTGGVSAGKPCSLPVPALLPRHCTASFFFPESQFRVHIRLGGVRENTRSAISFTYVDRVYIHADRQSKSSPQPSCQIARARSIARSRTRTHRTRTLALVQTLCSCLATHDYEASTLPHREQPARTPAAQESEEPSPGGCSTPTSTWTRRKAKARRLVATCVQRVRA